jgi:hypothetical protein
MQNVVSKKFNCTGALRVYRLKIDDSCVHLVMLVFSTQLCDLYSPVLPLSLSLWFNSPPPFLVELVYCMYIHSVQGGVWGSVADQILQEFNILYLTRFRTYKIVRLPQTKT